MQTVNSGIHHLRVGDLTVTALNDGQMEAPIDWMAGVPAAECEQLLRDSFRAVPPRITANAFLLTMADKSVLIDTGGGSAMGPDYGNARRRLAVLGVEPRAIGTILLTHAHIDHACGLLDAEDGPYFPNAELVMHEAEADFWLDEARAAQAPDAAKDFFALAQRCLAPYRDRIRTTRHGAEVLPGVVTEHLPGHTPGHSGWLITSGTEALLVWGDVVHVPAIQFPRPDAGVVFDTDPEQAQASRRRGFDMAASDRLRVAGMHLDFPAFGHVSRGAAGFAYVPDAWMPAI